MSNYLCKVNFFVRSRLGPESVEVYDAFIKDGPFQQEIPPNGSANFDRGPGTPKVGDRVGLGSVLL